ncbi:MAG TPA: hypothetical protein DCE42_01065 [Myxococcales bacterium]|nr:hypothetical protein [Deltaproteobacteria bacterium]HAA53311.1 hypothetical protein [Myxococcales bacterium]
MRPYNDRSVDLCIEGSSTNCKKICTILPQPSAPASLITPKGFDIPPKSTHTLRNSPTRRNGKE